jgi:hypothetical protein
MDSARIVYVPRPDATPESELNALAAVYRFILFDSHASKKARPTTSGPNDAAKEIKNGCDDREKYTRA